MPRPHVACRDARERHRLAACGTRCHAARIHERIAALASRGCARVHPNGSGQHLHSLPAHHRSARISSACACRVVGAGALRTSRGDSSAAVHWRCSHGGNHMPTNAWGARGHASGPFTSFLTPARRASLLRWSRAAALSRPRRDQQPLHRAAARLCTSIRRCRGSAACACRRPQLP